MKLMSAFHFFSFVEHETARSDQISELFKSLQDDLFTGIAQIQEDENCFIAVYAHGRIATIYHLDGQVSRLDGRAWLTHIEKSQAELVVRALSMPVSDLRLFKIAIEGLAGGRNTDTEIIDPKMILAKLKETPRSSLTFGETSTFAFLNYFSGLDAERDRSVVISPERIQNISIDELMLGLPEELKTTHVMAIDTSEPGLAWIEHQYHEIFVRALMKFMSVYGSMRERVYLNKIIRSVNFKADANDLLILVNARDVNDQEIFDSPSKCARTYAELLALAAGPVRTELGENVYSEVLGTIGSKSTDFQKKLLERLLSVQTID